ncbi:MAG: sigma 54-interacting transcriptional regulator [Candidatus Cloacimonetes bacterium]|nr:sigma 54-interacting transcriptional regulator [Candidatus Cloacimonadota bacterium]
MLVNNELLENISDKLQLKKSQIIEVVGESGSGKSFVFKELSNYLIKKEISFLRFVPSYFKYNQFEEIVKLITNITDETFHDIILQAQQLEIKEKYDLFYLFSENLDKKKLFQSKIVIIYEGCYLDEYTIDFIQYLTQYSAEHDIQFVIFNRKETFPFSVSIQIPIPKAENIRQVIQNILSKQKSEFISESEIIYNISKGNLFVIENILRDQLQKKKTIDLSAFMDKKISINTIYLQMFKYLDPSQIDLLITIFLLDTEADLKNLKKVITTNLLNKDLKFLIQNRVIHEIDNKYFIKKINFINEYFLNLSKTKRKKYYEPVIKILDKKKCRDFCVKINDFDETQIKSIINKLTELNDHSTLLELYKIYLEKIDNSKRKIYIYSKLGIINKRLGNYDIAAENFRLSLKLCITNSLPAEDIVFYLAETLYLMNSTAFALEIIKKYSSTPKDKYVHCRIILLKAKILTEIGKFEKALKSADEAFLIADQIKDTNIRFQLKADYKKIKGKTFYHTMDWTKAETEFEDAEKFYSNINNIEGLAAIYNNLGVVAMDQKDWKKTETLFLKSIEYERKRFSLNGISITYNNLGSLLEDQGDYNKSLFYLNEALKIQKLLSDSYNMTDTYHNIGITYTDLGKYKEAERSFSSALEMAIKFNIDRNISAALNGLGALFFKSGDFSKAIDYYEQAIKKSKDNNYYSGLCSSYNNIGELYEKRGEYNIALDFYSKGKELLTNFSDDFLKAELYGNLGSVLTALHQFKDAYKYLVESYDFFKELNAKDKIIEGSQKKAFYFIQTRNYESANYYLESALKLAEEIGSDVQIGNCHYLKAILEKKNPEIAQEFLEKAIEKFIKTKNNFELAMANYEYASILLEKKEWEQALQILHDNKKLIQKFEAIKFLEKNDVLINKINKNYAIELKETKLQESTLNTFYEITQELNDITDFDILIETALDKLVGFAEADGGIFTLYNNRMVKDSWEYLIQNNFSTEDKDFQQLMDIVQKTFDDGVSCNNKQPHFAPEYNNIISFPLMIRNEKKGVICLFTKHGSHYFTEKMFNLISALCNQIVVIVENISFANLQKSHELIREELAASSTFANIIGKSKKIQDIFRMIEKIKNASTTILLEGSSGTGKELIARAIHFNSNRRNKKFVAQYCGALPETLLESELFGHIKGSFTGATHDKKGLFEVADSGTFFLDEIADISLSTQAKLLRFLQEGEIKKVGSTQTQNVDVRVICATNVSLKDKVDKGEFRLDLYYRLNVIKITVPSLKERKSDIPLLAVHFLDKYCRKLEKNINGVTDEAMKYMMNYDWPGNIRQLENEIERAVTLSEDESSIKSSDLSEEIFRFQDNIETINLLEEKSLKNAVEDLEKQMIVKVLEETDWNQTRTAAKLGLSRQGLIKKMQRYKLGK